MLNLKSKKQPNRSGLRVGCSFHHKVLFRINHLNPFHRVMKYCRLALLMKRK